MTISVVSICNRGLDLLGADPITSLTDGSKPANLCLRNYDAVRDATLRAYAWNSAKRRASLPAMSAAPAWGYARQFQLPEGPVPERCLRLWRTEQEALGIRGVEYKIEGRLIVTDLAAPLNIEYIAQLLDPALMDPLLAETIAARLGVYLAANLTESGARVQGAVDYYKTTRDEAYQADAMEGSQEDFATDDEALILLSRFGPTGSFA
jgi:hypothetical protein